MSKDKKKVDWKDIPGIVPKGKLPRYLRSGYEIDVSGPGGGGDSDQGIAGHVNDGSIHLTAEDVMDTIANLLQQGANISLSYNDAGDTLTIAVSGLTAGDIATSVIGTPTYTHLQHLMNFAVSAGRVSGGEVTDAGSETIDVASGAGFIKAVDSDTAEISFFDWTGVTGQSVPTDTTRYVGVEYNAGSPQVTVRSTDTWDLDTEFPLAEVVNQGGTLHVINNPWWTGDAMTNVIERLQSTGYLQRDERLGGLALGETGTRNITVTAGTIWSRLSEFIISSIDTSGADTFTTEYRDGAGGWITTSGVSQWPNTQYDDGSGTLATMNNNYYGNLWFYIETDGDLVMLYPQAEYSNLGNAEDEASPASIPDRVTETGLFIGRLLFQKGESTATLISSAFTTSLSTVSITDHGDLAGLADDDHTQYHTDARALTWLEGQQGTPSQILAKMHML